jgi:hypothetical protein
MSLDLGSRESSRMGPLPADDGIDSVLRVAWEYDAGEPYARKKHGWDKPHAGVKVDAARRGVRVGCCPSGMDRERAKAAVNAGMPYFDDPDRTPQAGDPPDRVFLVHEGVPYEARWTTRGRALHAFPILPEAFNTLPLGVRRDLARLAAVQGHDIQRWLARWAP